MGQKKSTPVKVADDYTQEDIDAHLSGALGHIGNVEKEWVGLVKLPSADKNGNVGKLVSRLGQPLHALFTALTPQPGDDEPKRKAKANLAAVFDSMLGNQDRGKDPAHFEVDLLLRRLSRVEAEMKIAAALAAARERFMDDVMNTGEMVMEPGLRALEVARTAAASNPEFRSLLAPVLDKLGDMTKKARQRQDDARKAATTEPAPAEDDKAAAKGGKG